MPHLWLTIKFEASVWFLTQVRLPHKNVVEKLPQSVVPNFSAASAARPTFDMATDGR
jgi:hypothetical protein